MFVDHRTLDALAQELGASLRELGLDATVDAGEVRGTGPGRTDAGELLVDVDGRRTVVRAVSRSDLRPVHADELAPLAPGEAGIVFADRIAARSRDTLRQRGWGWFDRRRGRVRVWAPGLRLDAEIAPTVQSPDGPDRPVSGPANPFTPAGKQLTLWLLTHPDEHASPRAVGREIGVSPSQVSVLLQTLAAEALLRKDRRPLVPELFWALAEHWRPQRHPLVSMPSPSELAASRELRADRWVATDTRAALSYGAPVVASADYPVDLYLPDERALSWLLGRSVRAAEWSQRTATVAVAPTALACDPRLRRAADPWPLAHPVVVALDLASDRARGREIVEQWNPDEADVRRVW